MVRERRIGRKIKKKNDIVTDPFGGLVQETSYPVTVNLSQTKWSHDGNINT